MTLVTLRATPAAKGWVDVSFVGPDGKTIGAIDPTTKQVLLDRPYRVQLDADGLATVELKPTSAVDPPGTLYRADFHAGRVQESLLFGGFTGSGPVEATDHKVKLPADIVFEDGGGAVTGAGGVQDGGGA